MGRKPGSKNKPRITAVVETVQPKKGRGRPPKADKAKEQYMEQVRQQAKEAEPTMTDVLNAISNLGNYVGQIANEVEQLKSGQVPISTVVTPGQTRLQIPPPNNFAANIQTMQLDHGIDPPPSEELLAIVNAESDAVIQSGGLKKLQDKQSSEQGIAVPSLGRLANKARKDIKCSGCGSPPPPRGAWSYEGATSFTQNGIQSKYLCNSCLSAGKR